MKAALLLLAGASAAAPAPEPPRAAASVTILYLADLGGQLEPCGCSADQRGGLPRLAALVARLRRENPGALLVAGGDLLFEGPLDPERREVALVRARAAAAALRGMGLAATVAGERDLAAGEAFLRGSRLPFGETRRVGVVGLGVPGKVPAAPLRVALVHRGGTREAAPLAAALRAEGVDLVLAAHREALTDDDVNRALLGGPVPVVQVQSRGQSLARIDVRLAGDRARGFAVLEGPAQREEEIDLAEQRAAEYRRRAAAAHADGSEELARALAAKVDELLERARALRQAPLPEPPADRPSLTVSFLPVTQDLPEDPAVRRIVDRAHAAAARADLAAARAGRRPCPAPAPGAPVHVGLAAPAPGAARSCRECHPAAWAQWRSTPHARAYATLEKRRRQLDLDCVACHVTGWREPGGACGVDRVAGREDVQCEACHGPASLHAADPPGHILREPPEERCRACHTPEHSTRFEPRSYRKRVLGPGHGAP
ncbi:MAG TPA: multiheme c-type cytochrome [Anaeromyxobacteraceae bacterium]